MMKNMIKKYFSTLVLLAGILSPTAGVQAHRGGGDAVDRAPWVCRAWDPQRRSHVLGIGRNEQEAYQDAVTHCHETYKNCDLSQYLIECQRNF
jgi:hypothetical protein